jgi:hypothetical protein
MYGIARHTDISATWPGVSDALPGFLSDFFKGSFIERGATGRVAEKTDSTAIHFFYFTKVHAGHGVKGMDAVDSRVEPPIVSLSRLGWRCRMVPMSGKPCP